MRCHFISIKMTIRKKEKRKIASVSNNVEKLESLHIADGNIK